MPTANCEMQNAKQAMPWPMVPVEDQARAAFVTTEYSIFVERLSQRVALASDFHHDTGSVVAS